MNDGRTILNVINDRPLYSRVLNVFRKRYILKSSDLSPPPSTPLPLQISTTETSPQQLNVLFKHFADLKRMNTCKGNNSPGDIDMPATSFCNMCCRKDDVCVNLQHNHTIVLTLSDITRLPSWNIRQILASMCSRCLVYINAITDSSSKLRMRCEQAMHSQTVAPPTPDTSPNNFLHVSKTLLDDTPGHSNNEEQQRNCYAPVYCDDAPKDLSMPPATSCSPHPTDHPSTLEKPTLNESSRSPSPNNAAQNSMLKIRYEQPVSPLNTESGGGGKNRKRNYQRIQIIPVQMICTYCNRAYWRKDYYRKHMRRCTAKHRYAKSVTSQQSRSRSRLELDYISVASERNELITTHHKPRSFRCHLCNDSFENVIKLRQHKRVHMTSYICNICGSEYTSANEYDFHRVQCVAKKEVFEKALSDVRNGVNNMPARRKTRSYSRAISVAHSLAPSEVASTKKSKTPAKNSRTPRRSKRNTTRNDDERSKITIYAKRQECVYDRKKLNNETDFRDSDEDGDVDDDGDMSEVDTLYSKRMSSTNHWVEEHSISSHSHLSQGDNYVNDSMEDIAFSSLKEYDLYLLERLENEIKLRFITCFVPDCRFVCETLGEMMVHDYLYHYKMPWFNCHKCGHYFTSKVFLDYHLFLQNKGRYVCYKCGGNFDYQHQLDRHLIQHSRVANNGGEKYVCFFCNLKFLDEDKLSRHCYYENHDWKEKRHTIEIDHSMTISNKVHQNNRLENNKKYQEQILDMVLKLLPTKRSTPMEKYRFHLAPHLRIPKRIGRVEFPYPNNPNCVGCL